MSIRNVLNNVKTEAARVGYVRAISGLAYYAVNLVLYVRRLDVIYMTRAHLAKLDPAKYTQHASRLATEAELVRMQAEGKWDLTDELLEGFRAGDRCLLSEVGGKLAGYTWVHAAGRPRLTPGLRISIPDGYLYNFAGFTLPEFRGCGLQPYRHHAILGQPEWSGMQGMIGYVEATNWSSKKGQGKSGYQPLGTITMVGARQRFGVVLSDTVRRMGIRRLHD